MARAFPSIDRLGEEPIMIVTFPFGSFSDRELVDGLTVIPGLLKDVGNLDAVTTVGGSGASGSINVTIHDTDGRIKSLMETQDLRFMPATITQDWDDAALASVTLFQGQINNISWNSATLEVSISIVTKVESNQVGCSVEDFELITGDVGSGDDPKYASDQTGRPPSELVGKAWPLCFGRVIKSPTVKFSWVQDATQDEDDDDDNGKSETARVITIDGTDRWLPIDAPTIREYIKAIRALGTMRPGDPKLIARLVRDDNLKRWGMEIAGKKGAGREDQQITPAGILSNAQAWNTFSKLRVEFEKFRHGVLKLKRELFEVALDENVIAEEYKEFNPKQQEALAGQGIFTEQDYLDDQLNRDSSDILKELIDTSWIEDRPIVLLNKGHGLRNPKKLPLDDPLLNSMEVNISGQRFAGRIIGSEDILNFRPNELRLLDPLPVCSNIPFFEREADLAIRIKVKRNVKLDGMFGIVECNGAFWNLPVKMVVFFNEQEVVTTERPGDWDDEADGAFKPEYLYSWVGYQPLAFFVFSDDIDNVRDKTALVGGEIKVVGQHIRKLRDYYAFVDFIEHGTIVETSYLMRPSWFTDVPENDLVVLDKDTWQFNKLETQWKHPNLPLQFVNNLLSTYGQIPKSGYEIKAGDSVVPWDGCPKALEDGEEKEDDSTDTSDGKPYTYIANCIPDSIIHAVYAFRDIPGKKNPLPVEVPSRYYTWGNYTILGKEVTAVQMDKPLSTRGEGWADEIYVVMTSPIGPNTADIIEWLIGEYGPELTVNATSFAETAALIEPFPSDFCILDRPNLLTICKEIAFQARCALWLKGNEVFMKYLAKEPTSGEAIDIGTDFIAEGTFLVESTDITDLVTEFKGEWHPSYLDLDADGNEINRFMVLLNNVDVYGLHQREHNFFIYNQETLVRKAMEFWLIRWSNTWQVVSFEAFIEALTAETLDAVELLLPAGLLGPTTVKGIAEQVIYDSNNLSAQFRVWTPIRLGENTQYPNAWLQ